VNRSHSKPQDLFGTIAGDMCANRRWKVIGAAERALCAIINSQLISQLPLLAGPLYIEACIIKRVLLDYQDEGIEIRYSLVQTMCQLVLL
jgi:hypothetical protein